jgi:hypothetical protein
MLSGNSVNSDPIYFLNNYGQCKLDKCMCIDRDNPRFDGAWGGLACPDWVANGSQDLHSMIERAKLTYMANKNDERTRNTQRP